MSWLRLLIPWTIGSERAAGVGAQSRCTGMKPAHGSLPYRGHNGLMGLGLEAPAPGCPEFLLTLLPSDWRPEERNWWFCLVATIELRIAPCRLSPLHLQLPSSRLLGLEAGSSFKRAPGNRAFNAHLVAMPTERELLEHQENTMSGWEPDLSWVTSACWMESLNLTAAGLS